LLRGIWSKWSTPDGGEIESCCVLTTEPYELVKPIHNRMPVVVPEGYESNAQSKLKMPMSKEVYSQS
tara:strand:+ start:278 stop:478 length:201 start_codon:yes stop_codon:yes gene_type:complete